MKKYLLLILIAIFIGIVIPQKLHAVDISVGASTWYCWWTGGSPTDEEPDPTFLYGPALSVKFNDEFNLTFVYLYGKYDMPGMDDKFKRKDSDLALNYRLNNFFKVFAGLKYLGVSTTGFDWYGVGPGLGLSAAFPVAENLFLLANVSGFHIWSTEDQEGKSKTHAKGYGINSTLSLAYYIAPASTTISLGGRYQFINSDYKDSEVETTKFYGVTLAATYTFSI